MAYAKQTWIDGENKYDITTQTDEVIQANIKLVYKGTTGSPLSSTRMNHIEEGIANLLGGNEYNEVAYESYYSFSDPLADCVAYEDTEIATNNNIGSVLNKYRPDDNDIYFDTGKRITIDFDLVNFLKIDYELARTVTGGANPEYTNVKFRLRNTVTNDILVETTNFTTSDPYDGTYIWFSENVDAADISGEHEYAVELAMHDGTAYNHYIDMYNRGLDCHKSKVRRVRWE